MALFSLANQPGAAFRAALNTILGKLQSNNAGTTDPVTASESAAGMLWLDQNPATDELKIRNGDDTAWVTVGGIGSTFEIAGTTAFTRTLLDDLDAATARTTLGAAALSVDNTFTGENVFEVRPIAKADVPAYRWWETDQAAGNRGWQIRGTGGELHVDTIFDDGTLQSGSLYQFHRDGSAPDPESVMRVSSLPGALAALPFGSIGTYVFATRNVANDALQDELRAGSSLVPISAARAYNPAAGAYEFNLGTTLAGTWRCMGRYDHQNGNSYGATLWLRIS